MTQGDEGKGSGSDLPTGKQTPFSYLSRGLKAARQAWPSGNSRCLPWAPLRGYSCRGGCPALPAGAPRLRSEGTETDTLLHTPSRDSGLHSSPAQGLRSSGSGQLQGLAGLFSSQPPPGVREEKGAFHWSGVSHYDAPPKLRCLSVQQVVQHEPTAARRGAWSPADPISQAGWGSRVGTALSRTFHVETSAALQGAEETGCSPGARSIAPAPR